MVIKVFVILEIEIYRVYNCNLGSHVTWRQKNFERSLFFFVLAPQATARSIHN